MSEILDECKRRFGISFSEVHTGGGCFALEARLESGHWIVATDEGLGGFSARVSAESRDSDDDYQPRYSTAGGHGWSIGIYENQTDHGDDWWGGEESIVDVVDMNARAEKLPDMVEAALLKLVTHPSVANRNRGDSHE